MNTLLRTSGTVLGASLALALSGAATAQTVSPKIVIDNLNPKVEIPLVTASQVQFEADGDLVVQCRLNGSTCPGIGDGTGQTGTGPVAFALTPSLTTVPSGQAFTLSWNSTDAEACYAVSPTGISGWTSGNRALSNNSSASVTITNSGTEAITQTFQIRCFNANGSRTVSSPTVTINAGTTPNPPDGANYCDEYYPVKPTSPNFTAHGLERHTVNFGTIWNGITPGGIDIPRGVPGPHLIPAQGRYLAIPFTMTEDSPSSPLSQFLTTWDLSQLSDTPGAAVSITVSPCPGDFRAPTTFGVNPTDNYLTSLCRGTFGNNGVLQVDATSVNNGCYAPKGKQMYINIATYNMFNATLPSQTTCLQGATHCGVMMKMD